MKQHETYAKNQSGHKTDQRDQPTFQYEYVSYGTFCGSHAAEGTDILALLDDEHRETSEDIESDNDDYEEQLEYLEDAGDYYDYSIGCSDGYEVELMSGDDNTISLRMIGRL